jgi:type VI secretion system secreted protein VgrG
MVTAQGNLYESGGSPEQESFHCRFTALGGEVPFRPRRITPKPIIQGPQTAIVVGKAGEEIWTDKHGRAKVQFHWDRYGKKDENSSCWVRISQAWAGKGWGGVHLPRIGQEVIVEFLEGDPDQPIITGRVYNGDNKVPYDLPANQTQSGLLSRSTKEGSTENFNQLRFEDKKGEEEVYIHAEKDHKIEVENDKNENVGNNESISIGNDRTETVGNDETITVNNNRTETVMANETLTVQQDRTRNVNKNEIVTVALTRTRNVGINEAVNVGVAQEITVGGFRALTVGAYQNTEIALNHSESIGNNYSLEVGDSRDADVGENDKLKVGKKLTIEAGEEVSITTGKASIVMKKDGTITIKGKDIMIEGSGAINVKASKDLVLKGSKVLQN